MTYEADLGSLALSCNYQVSTLGLTIWPIIKLEHQRPVQISRESGNESQPESRPHFHDPQTFWLNY